MSVASLTALLLAGTPVAAEVPPPEVLLQQVEVDAAAAEPVETANTAPAAAEPAPDNEIIVSSSAEAPPGDPLANINAQSYDATQAVDDVLVGPLARGYEDVVPRPVRSGLRNFIRNLKAPIIALNFLLQLKPGKAAETLGRFVINSTVGVAGLIDVAKDDPFNLPFRPNGFADTLGYYGVGPGPFFFLPLVGPTTLRDLIGGGVDGLVMPTLVGGPFSRIEYSIPSGVVGALDYRIQFDDELRVIRSTEDPYTAAREHYLKMRQDQIDTLRGIKVDSSAFTVPAVEAPAPAETGASGEATDTPEPELQD